MMQMVIITQTAKTESGAYYAGEKRNVSPEVAQELIGNGWAAPAAVTLEVQSAKLGVKSEDV